jgi:CYTH domain-containing protein
VESFEHVCKVALEAEGFVVTTNVKFPVTRQTKKASRAEFQTHGYEVDLVGARTDELVLASVKSFFGSHGVSLAGLEQSGYKLFNDLRLREEVVRVASERYGYAPGRVKLRLYVGRFAPRSRDGVIAHLRERDVEIRTPEQVAELVLKAAESKTYTDDPVITTVKLLKATGHLKAADADRRPRG